MYSLFKKIVPCRVFPGADFDLFSKPTTTEALGAMVQECARDAVTGPTWDGQKCGNKLSSFSEVKKWIKVAI